MFLKLKPIVLFVTVFSISCLALNCVGLNASLFAQEIQSSTKKEYPSYKTTSGCESKRVCCKQIKSCYHEKKCTSKPGCSPPCNKQSKCNKGGGHSVDDMINLAHCAKKELLKEKIKANLETKIGSKLDKVADLLVDTMLEEYKAGRESKERRADLKEKLFEIFSEKNSK
jgi:hypothetical protein